MNIDDAKIRFDELTPAWNAHRDEIETEQDVRFQMINRMIVEVLGWPQHEIKTEPPTESGFVDYLLSADGRGRLVVEAKRTTVKLLDTKVNKLRWYKAGGPALTSANEGLIQAGRYCQETATMFSAVSNGFQWIGYWPLRTDGVRPMEGQAAVFPSLEAIAEDFGTFFDLFSRDGVLGNLFVVHVHEAEGLRIRQAEDLQSVTSQRDIKLLSQTAFSQDLRRVFQRFFSTLAGVDDPDMLRYCFVETRESQEADDNLEKIARNLIDSVSVMDSSKGHHLTDEIRSAVESKKGEFVLIVGNKGAGKSTFVDRFFKQVLDPQLRKRCCLVRIDVADSSGDIAEIAGWLTKELKNKLASELFDDGIPTYDQLQGIFYREYDEWRKGPKKPLYDSDRQAFKIEFGAWLTDMAVNDPQEYVRRLLESSIHQRKLMPCLVFDNTDHYAQAFQEAVFQYAQSVYRSAYSFIICPITDRTIWQLSKEGPLQSYETRVFYLPVPSTKEVLAKRVQYIRKKTADSGEGGSYFAASGIKISIPNIEAFASCIEDIFVNEDFIGRIIAWLSNHDIRRSLKIAEQIITSPTLTIGDLVGAYVAGRPACPRPRQIKQALIRGSYNHYVEADSNFITNLFTVDPKNVTSPLVRLSILRLLMDKEFGSKQINDTYLSVREIHDYFEPMGFSGATLDWHLLALLERRLIIPYDPTDVNIRENLQVKVSHAGRIHYEFAFDYQENTYVTEMALGTQMRTLRSTEQDIRNILFGGGKLDWSDWMAICSCFIRYCRDEDRLFVTIPKLEAYSGQRQMREDLASTWRVSS